MTFEDDVKREAQKRKAMELIETLGLSPALASLAARTDAPDSTGTMLKRELERYGQQALASEAERRTMELNRMAGEALKRGDTVASIAAKNAAYKVHREEQERLGRQPSDPRDGNRD